MIKIKKESVLITPKDIKPSSRHFKVLGVFNPGAVRLPNGDIVLYVRVAEKLTKDEDDKHYYSPRFAGKNDFSIKIDKFSKKSIVEKNDISLIFEDGTKRLTFISYLKRVVLDKTGFKVKSVDKKPSFFGLLWDGELGIEDPRITKINKLYIMTYVSLSERTNISTSYAVSNDCLRWHREGVIFIEQNKDAVLFPERVNNEYIAFNRPESAFQFSLPHIWISYSENLKFWGKATPIKLPEKTGFNYIKVGAGPPPIKTEKGWLLLYHLVSKHEKEKSFIDDLKSIFIYPDKKIIHYSVGAALFDLKNPKKLIAKSESPILTPDKDYEKGTFMKNIMVVFPTGLILDENEEDVLIFSGGGDTVVTVKKVCLNDILGCLKKV